MVRPGGWIGLSQVVLRLILGFAILQATLLVVEVAMGVGVWPAFASLCGGISSFLLLRRFVWRRSSNGRVDAIVLFAVVYLLALGVSGLLSSILGAIAFFAIILLSCEWFVFSLAFPAILRKPLFLSGLAIRLVLLPIAGGQSLLQGVIPLVTYFTRTGLNPYDAFLGSQVLSLAYPLSPLIVGMLSIPVSVARLVSFHPLAVLGLAKLPLLLADVAILLVLRRLVRPRTEREENRLLWLYWLSPIVLYVTYVQGQLDILPIAILLLSLLVLWRRRFLLGALLLGVGIAAKANVIVALPFVAIFLWRSGERWWKVIGLSVLACAPYVLIVAAFRSSPGFMEMLALARTEIARIALHSSISLGDIVVYLVPLLIILLGLRITYYRIVTRDTVLMALAVAFLLLILLSPPLSGWFLWSLPFVLYFFLKHETISTRHLHLANVAFLGYFLLASPASEVFSAFAPILSPATSLPPPVLLQTLLTPIVVANLAFTLLAGTLLINGIWVYTHGLIGRSERFKPLLIGIAGDSGAGKNRTTDLLAKALGERDVTMLEGDDLHRWERGDAHWSALTHLDPRANRLQEDVQTARRLSRRRIDRPRYDHSTGRFTRPAEVRAARYVVLNGLHALYLPQQRDALDLKVFLDPSPTLRLHWKVVRDVGERGYTRAKVLSQVKRRERDARKHIAPQAKHADVVVSLRPVRQLTDQQLWDASYEPDLRAELRVRPDFDLLPIIEQLQAAGADVSLRFVGGAQVVSVDTGIPHDEYMRIARLLLGSLESVAEGDALFADGIDGAVQLLLVWCLHQRERERDADA